MMISGYSIWAVLFISAGVFCAAFVDAIGGGGGIIAVPVYLMAGLPTHFALGTNKLSSCVGTAVSTYRYIRSSRLDWLLTVPAVLLALLGAHLGTSLQIIPHSIITLLINYIYHSVKETRLQIQGLHQI